MRIHPREKNTNKAESILDDAILKILKEIDLTDAEYIQVITHTLNSAVLTRVKYIIREERHGNQDKPGGLA